MEITKDTRLADLIAQYPWLKAEMAKVNEKFKMLNSSIGKIMMGKATIAEMSKKSGMEAEAIIEKIPQGVPSTGPAMRQRSVLWWATHPLQPYIS